MTQVIHNSEANMAEREEYEARGGQYEPVSATDGRSVEEYQCYLKSAVDKLIAEKNIRITELIAERDACNAKLERLSANKFVKLVTNQGVKYFRKDSVVDFRLLHENPPERGYKDVYVVDVDIQTSTTTSVSYGYKVPSQQAFDDFVHQMSKS